MYNYFDAEISFMSVVMMPNRSVEFLYIRNIRILQIKNVVLSFGNVIFTDIFAFKMTIFKYKIK